MLRLGCAMQVRRVSRRSYDYELSFKMVRQGLRNYDNTGMWLFAYANWFMADSSRKHQKV